LLGQRELTVYNPSWELEADLATEIPSKAKGDTRVIVGCRELADLHA
jgi:hypothetical protein